MTDDALQLPLIEAKEKMTKIKKIPLDNLPSNEHMDLPAGKPSIELVEDILHKGQRESIQIVEFPDGKVHIEAGRGRIAAFRILRDRFPDDKRWKRIRAEVAEGEDYLSVLLGATSSNNMRQSNVLTDLRAIMYLQEQFPTIGKKSLAYMTGINPSTLTKRMNLFKLTQDWSDLLWAGKLLPTIANEISKQTPETQTKLWGVYKIKGKITKEDIKDAQRVRQKETVEEHQDVLFPELKDEPKQEAKTEPEVELCPHCGQPMP